MLRRFGAVAVGWGALTLAGSADVTGCCSGNEKRASRAPWWQTRPTVFLDSGREPF